MTRDLVRAACGAALVLVAACQAPRDMGFRSGVTADGWTPVALETLAGRTWMLRAWDRDEPAPEEPRVTLQYRDGRLTGRSGCNRYTGPVSAGATDGAITVGALAGTRMMCPEPAHGVESRFLSVLSRARELRMQAGRLAIVYDGPRGAATLIFDETRAVAN